MAIVVPEGFAQVTLNWQHSETDKQWSTVLASDVGIATAADVAETYELAWSVELMQATDTSLVLASVLVRMGPSVGPDPGLTVEVPVGTAGTSAMTGAPSNCTVLVRKLSVFGGRANRGRNYWPGMISDGNVDEVGRLEGSHVTYLQTRMTEFFGALGSGNGATTAVAPAVILHDETSPSQDPRLVSAVQVDPVIGTQRRRVR